MVEPKTIRFAIPNTIKRCAMHGAMPSRTSSKICFWLIFQNFSGIVEQRKHPCGCMIQPTPQSSLAIELETLTGGRACAWMVARHLHCPFRSLFRVFFFCLDYRMLIAEQISLSF
eukprot:IDg15353t1